MSYRKYFHHHVRVKKRGWLNTYFGIDAPPLSDRIVILGNDVTHGLTVSDVMAQDPDFENSFECEEYYLDPYTNIEISVNNFMYTLYRDGTEDPGYHTLLCPVESIDHYTYGSGYDFDRVCVGSRFPNHADYGDKAAGFPVYPDELYVKVRNIFDK